MVSHYFDDRGGGIEIVAARLCRALAEAAISVCWIATAPAQPPSAARGACTRLAVRASDRLGNALGVPYPLLAPSAVRRIYREVAGTDIVMVHDALYLTSIVAALAAWRYRKPLVIVQHVGLVPYRSLILRGLMRLANRLIAARMLRRAEQVVFISQTTLRQFAGIRLRAPAELVFNAVDTDTFSLPPSEESVAADRTALGLPAGGPVVLFVGRFVEKKGLAILERLARSLSTITFAFAGRGKLDPERWQLPNVMCYRTLSGASLAPLYRASDVLVLPSVGEGFPLVVQEALASGLAVICGEETVAADDRARALLTGIAVDLSAPEASARRFAEAITRELARPGDPSHRHARRDFAVAHYSPAASVREYLRILRRLHGATADSRW